MAKQRKRRKGVGPPPAVSPRRDAAAAAAATGKATGKAPVKRGSSEPVRPSPRGVLLRAGIVAVLFLPYLIFLAGEDPIPALVISVVAFALMVPLGLLIDRIRYNRQMRKYEEKRAGSARK